jgi:Domain of unknown function (DUF1707)
MEPNEPSARWTADFGQMRASDTDRERVVDALKTAFVQGRLNQDELAGRVGHALESRTYGELVGATAGLPVRRAPVPRPPRPAAPVHASGPTWKAVAWAVSLAIALPGAGVAFFATTYGSFFVLLLVGFFASGALGSPGRPGEARHRAY